MKRLVKAILVKHKIPHRVHDSKQVLGRAIDFFVQGGKSEENQTEEKRTTRRWSAKMDMARMLQLMFGSEEGKSKYLLSRQLANRQQLDDHKTKSVKAEYWVNLAKQYNDSSVEVEIDVGAGVVNLYLKQHLSAKFRCAWEAHKLRECFRKLRSDYEGSEEYRRFGVSGQNDGQNFYPDFQKHNPSHVMLHYLIYDMAKGSVLGDLPANTMVDTSARKVVDITVTPDTSPAAKTVVDVTGNSSSEEEEEQEQVATPVTPDDLIIRRKRARSRSRSGHNLRKQPRVDYSPESEDVSSQLSVQSVGTSASGMASVLGNSTSASGMPASGMASVLGNISTILGRLGDSVTASARKQDGVDVIDQADYCTRLIDRKKNLQTRLREMQEEGSDVDEDSLALVEKQLKNVTNKIKSLL